MVEILNIGLTPYQEAWDLQRQIFEQVAAGQRDQGVLLLCQHPHVYTLGKSGESENLLIDQATLDRIGAEFVKVDRGGDITYHGPGQLVGYPILALDRLNISLRQYIFNLEQVLIDTASDFGITADRLDGATGVWIEGLRKIAAIGVRASRSVTMHGFAFNISTNLDYFRHINPCGFIDKGVTSFEKEGKPITIDEVIERVIVNFEKTYNCKTTNG